MLLCQGCYCILQDSARGRLLPQVLPRCTMVSSHRPSWPGLPAATPKGIEAETFKQLSRENMPPMPPPGGRGPRGGSGAFGPDDRWQSGRMPAGAVYWLGPGMEQSVSSFCWVLCLVHSSACSAVPWPSHSHLAALRCSALQAPCPARPACVVTRA